MNASNEGVGEAAALARTPSAAAAVADLPADLQAAVLDHAPPLYLAKPEGRIIFANAGYRALAAQLDGEEIARLPDIDELMAMRERGGPLTFDHRIIADDKVRAYEATYEAVTDGTGRPRAVVARFTERDEAHQLNAALGLARDRLDDIARLVSDWIWETDRDLRFVFVSPRVTEVLGYHPMELIGRAWSSLVVENDPLADAGNRRRPPKFRDREVVIADRDGKRRLFRLCGVPVYDPDSGRLAGYRGTAQDVTDIRAREDAVLEAKAAAEQASQAKSQFLANMSHELRTPLNAIIGFAEMMQSEAFGALGHSTYRDYVNDIAQSGRHLLQLINDVLDVAKAESGRFELREDRVDAADTARQAVRTVAQRAEHAGVELALDVPADAPALRADGVKLTQILMNLLANAVKFTNAGGRVSLRLQPPAEADGVAFCVSDTGIGMSAEEIEVALTPFGQVENGAERRHEGTGLGLPLARSLIELHGGRLEIESTPGEGTTVRAVLPRERCAAAAWPEASRPSPAS